nr:hypothetical protein [Microctonus hyperodae filamentous virus]
MYHNRSWLSRTKHRVGTTFFLIIILLIIVTCYILAIYLLRNKNEIVSTKNLKLKYTLLIYNYLQAEFTENDLLQNEINIQSFSFNDTLFSSYRWFEDAEQFGSTIKALINLLYATTLKGNVYYRSTHVWKILKHSTNTICKKFSFPLVNYQFPWGKNWYQFSISFPKFLVFAAFLHRHEFGHGDALLDSWLKQIITHFLPSPKKSIGWNRDGPNSVMMSVPYMGGHLLLNDYSRILKESDFLYVLDYINSDYVSSGEGFYADGGFVFHGTLRAYGYIYSSLNDFKLIADFFNFSDALNKIVKIKTLLDNPHIPIHFCPWFTRGTNLTYNNTNQTTGGTGGFDFMPSTSIISIKTKHYTLQFNGQNKRLCFYEADQANFQWAQYWIMARQFYYKNSDVKLRPELITRYPGVISINNTPLILRTPENKPTTHTFMCRGARTIICKCNDSCIGIYNEYQINELDFEVCEMMLITDEGYTVCYTINYDDSTNVDDSAALFVSVNLGHLSKNDVYKTPNVHRFEHNSSIIYNIDAKNILLQQCERTEDAVKLDSLQIKLTGNAVNDGVAFSTFHGQVPPTIQVAKKNVIISDKYKMFYIKNNLYLCDIDKNHACVGKYSDLPLAVVQFKVAEIKRIFGTNTKICNYGIYSPAESKYLEVTNYLRNFSIFSNITIPSNDQISTWIRADEIENEILT